jgi:hypothetical protein
MNTSCLCPSPTNTNSTSPLGPVNKAFDYLIISHFAVTSVLFGKDKQYGMLTKVKILVYLCGENSINQTSIALSLVICTSKQPFQVTMA